MAQPRNPLLIKSETFARNDAHLVDERFVQRNGTGDRLLISGSDRQDEVQCLDVPWVTRSFDYPVELILKGLLPGEVDVT